MFECIGMFFNNMLFLSILIVYDNQFARHQNERSIKKPSIVLEFFFFSFWKEQERQENLFCKLHHVAITNCIQQINIVIFPTLKMSPLRPGQFSSLLKVTHLMHGTFQGSNPWSLDSDFEIGASELGINFSITPSLMVKFLSF